MRSPLEFPTAGVRSASTEAAPGNAFYKPADLTQMADVMDEWLEREFEMLTKILIRSYRSPSAREIAMHGFSRRMQGLRHAMKRIFELLPPNEEHPDPMTVLDVTAMLQAFIISVFGAIDNLARIWTLESGLLGRNGKPLPASFIGFAPGNLVVRASVPPYLLEKLVAADGWFAYLEDYRHALAHRVPLYIPPKVLGTEDQTAFERLGREINDAVLRLDRSTVLELQARQSALGMFRPFMMHSFGEGAIPMRFHPQMLCDFSTVVLIAELTVRAVDELPAPASPS